METELSEHELLHNFQVSYVEAKFGSVGAPAAAPDTAPPAGEVVSFVQDGATVLPACGVAALPLEQEPMRAAFSPSAILNAAASANGEPSSPLRLT